MRRLGNTGTNPMISTTSFIKNILPGGTVPDRLNLDLDQSHTPVNIPFAIMAWDEELDYCTEIGRAHV